MKRYYGLIVFIIVLGFALPAPAQQDQQDPQEQQQQDQQQQQGPPEQQQKPEKRPTLAPEPAPGPGPGMEPVGPATDFVLDAAKLLRVRKVYVEPIDNKLGDKLMEGLAKSGRFKLVAEKKDADAIIRGTCFDARRLRSVHTEIFMSDTVTGKSIWQDTIRVPYNPPPLTKAVDATADRVLHHLANSVAKAQGH